MENKKQTPSPELELLWDYLKRDPEHKDRRQTGWGTKTQQGLSACIHRINRDSTEFVGLLAACESALSQLENMTTEQFSKGADKPLRQQLAAAIAKAKGVD